MTKRDIYFTLTLAGLALCAWFVFGKSCNVPVKPPMPINVTKTDTTLKHTVDSLNRRVAIAEAGRKVAEEQKRIMQMQINASRQTIAQLLASRKVYVRAFDTIAIVKNSDSIAHATEGYITQEQVQQGTVQAVDSLLIEELEAKDGIIAAHVTAEVELHAAVAQISAELATANGQVKKLNRRNSWLRVALRATGAAVIALAGVLIIK